MSQVLGLLSLGLRNIFRNIRRSILTCLVMASGLVFVFTARGFLSGLQREIVANLTEGELGDVQIAKQGFFEALPTRSFDYLFRYDDEIRRALRAEPSVAGVAPRLTFGGLLNHQYSQATTPFVAVGMEPAQERLVCPRLPLIVKEGAFLDELKERDADISTTQDSDVADAQVDGDINFEQPVSARTAKNLAASEEHHQIIIGTYMRDGLFAQDQHRGQKRSAALGDEVVLLASTAQGSQRSMVAKLSAVADEANPTANKTKILLVLSSAQRLLDAPGLVTQLTVRLKDPSQRHLVAKQLSAKLSGFGLEARSWDQIHVFFVNIMELQNAIFSVVMAVILLIVVIAIVIPTFMAVSERTREIGTLMAMGFRRHHIVGLFLFESIGVGFIGGMVGLCLGAAIVAIVENIGIPFHIPGTTVPVIIRPTTTLLFMGVTLGASEMAALIAGIFPALLASRLKPVDALGHN